MTGAPLVVLDACVLSNFSLCDTLLRLAEPPRLFEPNWSEEIIRETTRTLESKLGWPNSLTAYLEKELRATSGQNTWRHGAFARCTLSPFWSRSSGRSKQGY